MKQFLIKSFTKRYLNENPYNLYYFPYLLHIDNWVSTPAREKESPVQKKINILPQKPINMHIACSSPIVQWLTVKCLQKGCCYKRCVEQHLALDTHSNYFPIFKIQWVTFSAWHFNLSATSHYEQAAIVHVALLLIENWHLRGNQSGTKPNLAAKILAIKIGNLWALATKIGSQH